MTEERSFFDTGVAEGPQQPASNATATPARDSASAASEKPRSARSSAANGSKRPNALTLGMGIVGVVTLGLVGWALFSDPAPATRSGSAPVPVSKLAVGRLPDPSSVKPAAVTGAATLPHNEAEIPELGPAPSATAGQSSVSSPPKEAISSTAAIDAASASQLEARVSKVEQSLSHVDGTLSTLSDQIAALDATVAAVKPPLRSKNKPKGGTPAKPGARPEAVAKDGARDNAERPVRSLSGATY